MIRQLVQEVNVKLRFLFLIVIVSLAALLNAASINGNITDQQGVALNQCKVILHGIGDNPVDPPHCGDQIVYTNELGDFTFENVVIGSYTLRADKQGFLDAQYIDPATGGIYVIEIDADDQEVEGVNIIMIRCDDPPHGNHAIVSGLVKGTDGLPLSGIMVGVSYAAQPDSLIPFHYAESNWEGHYIINGLEIGQSYVVKAVNNFTMTAISDNFPCSPTLEIPNVVLDITLPYQGYSISGTAYDVTGLPIPHAFIVLYNIVPNTTNSIYLWIGTFADATGHYTLQHIVPGSYNMALANNYWNPVFYPSTMDYAAAGVVTVVDANVEGIDIHTPIPQTYIVSGYVIDAASALPLSGIQVRIDRPGMNHHGHHGEGGPADSTNTIEGTIATTDTNGYWSLNVLQGDYVFVAFDPTHTYATQFYNGASNPFEATHVDVNSDIDSLNFALTIAEPTVTCSISGVITENGAIPTDPVMVVAVSSDEDWEDAVMTDPNGAYTIHHLHPGNYYVVACSPTAPPTYYQNAISWEDAQLITVNGNVVGIDIQLNYTPLSGPSTMSGTVLSTGGSPLANVTVALKDNQNNIITFATTDANGQYSIPQLVDQNYAAIVTILNVPTLVTSVSVTGNVNRDFTLNAPTGTDDQTQTTPSFTVGLTNYPNPFNPVTTIAFNVPKASKVTVEVYNLKGQKVKTLVHGYLSTGLQQLNWNGTNDNGTTVASGIYFCKVKGNNFNSTHKMVMLK
jgi:hypothetical protein